MRNCYNRLNGWLKTGFLFSSLLLTLNLSAAGAWKFIFVADTQSGKSVTNAVNTNVCMHMARQIVNERPDFMLLPGDLILGALPGEHAALRAEYAEWTNAFSSVYAAGIPIYPIRGNHETWGDDTNGSVYLSVFGATVPGNGPAGEVGLTYSFAHNNALVIGLDQYVHSNQVNQAWLDSQLASNRYAHVFVFGHEPAVQVVENQCLALETAARDLFLKSITEAGCRMYLCAHDHFYNRGLLMPKNGIDIMQVVSGAGGAPFEATWDGIYGQNFGEQAMGSNCYFDTGTYGYSLVTVSNFNVTLEWKGSTNLITWTTYDTYSYQITNPASLNPTDFDGDSKADPAVYNDGYWSIYSLANGMILYNSGIWGGSGWTTAAGDYDGDGKADLAVYRDGYCSIYSLANGMILNNGGMLGGPGWTTAPGDYDGDGKADIAVYRDGYWSIYSLANGMILFNGGVLGGPGCTPVPRDYDGDSKSDLAVYCNGYCSIYSLTKGMILNNGGILGGAGWAPVPGDYDGDRKSDLAVYRNGYWSICSLANGLILYNTGPWGGSDWAPAPGDYDGDRKSDLAVYRNGYWSIYSLTNGMILNNGGVLGGPGWAPVQ